MLPLEIKKDIFWVGAVDFNTRDFHGYTIAPEGTTSNAYVIKDEKNVLFDTVKAAYSSAMICRLAHVIELEKIDYIVVNHVEMDHSGALPEIVKRCNPEKIFCSVMGEKTLKAHFNTEGWPIHVVKTGDVINIGKRNIHFIEARMLHWPDSMFSYIPEEKLLISNDAFGQNIASTARFADEVARPELDESMRHYYYNIVVPFSSQVFKVLDAVAEMKLEIDMLAPDHGLIFRTPEDVAYALESYRTFAEQRPEKRAVIMYDTMWNSTEKMAYSIAEGLNAEGIPSIIMDLKHNHHSFVMTELSRSGLFIAGSPTHNNGILANVVAALSYIKGLRPQNRLGAAFGSYGWSGESVKIIGEHLTGMGFEQPVDPVKIQYVPKHDSIKQCFEMGRALAAPLKEFCDTFK